MSEISALINVLDLIIFLTFNKLNVPPYKLLDATIWSPALNNTSKAVEIAAVPDAVTTDAIPPSRAANLCSNTSFVGLFNLV